MFAGVADYGVYLNAAVVKIEGKKFADLVWSNWWRLVDRLNHVSMATHLILSLVGRLLGLVGRSCTKSLGFNFSLSKLRPKNPGQVHTQTRPSRLLSVISSDSPQQETTTTTTSSTNYPANQSRWVTPLVFVQALAYVLHRVNRC